MTTIIKQNGSYTIKPGDNLQAIAASQGRTLADLLALNPQFKANPSMIQPGQTVYSSTPSYSSLTSNPNDNPQAFGPNQAIKTVTPPPKNYTSNNIGFSLPQGGGNSNPTTSFTEALIKMLKEAQQRDVTGQASLMKQSQGITGLGLNDANMNFRNQKLAPNAGTSLGMSAQNEFDPLQLSIANQQKLASQNLGNITDLVRQTGTSYDNEQDRITRAEENRLDRIASAAKASSNVTFDTQGTISKFSNSMKKIKGEDGYIAPEEWIAARELWASGGGSDSSFVSNFKRYLNPESYKLAGIKTTETEEEKTQALIESIFNTPTP